MLMLADWFFTLAVVIASFSYFLGLVLLSFKPVYPAVRGLAVDLVEDGYRLVVTLFVLNFIIFMVNSVGIFLQPVIESLCGDAEAAMNTVVNLQSISIIIVAALGIAVFIIALIKLLLSRSFLFISPMDIRDCMMKGAKTSYQVAKVLAPLSSIYGIVLLVQAFFIIFVQLIAYNWFLLAGLGVLLYILPFRIGERSGRMLLTFSLAAYLMIPLYAKMEQIFRNWLSQTYWFTTIFPFDLVVFKVMFPAMYFGFVAWLTAGVGLAAFNVMGMSPGLDWRGGVGLIGREVKAVAGFLKGGLGKGEEEEKEKGEGEKKEEGVGTEFSAEMKGEPESEFKFKEGEGEGEEGEGAGERPPPPPPPSGGEGGRPSPPSGKGMEEEASQTTGEETKPSSFEEFARRFIGEERKPSTPEVQRQPTPEEPTTQIREAGREVQPSPTLVSRERISLSDYTRQREVGGTRFAAHPAIPEQEVTNAVEAFKQLPEEEKRLVNLVRLDPFAFERVYAEGPQTPAAEWYDSTREIAVHGPARGYYETYIPHEVGHAIYRTDMTARERLEWKAIVEDWKTERFPAMLAATSQTGEYSQVYHAFKNDDEAFAYAYSKYRSGQGETLPSNVRTFIDKRLQERMRQPPRRRLP